jgi:hypothetical protein
MKIVVITPTTGKETVQRAITSVKNQTIPCEHWIINDGKTDFSCGGDVVINLPENTGRAEGKLWNGQRIYAGIPMMVNADYVFFLDEDNWFDLHHVETMVALCELKNLDWCYSLRSIYNKDEVYICTDNCESLGTLGNAIGTNEQFVDMNCYCIKGSILPKVSHHLHHGGWGEDRVFYKELSAAFPHFECTMRYSLNYTAPDRLLKMFKQNALNVNRDLDLEERTPSLFIATPMYGGMCAGYYTQSLLQLSDMLKHNGIGNTFSFMFNESLITRARNALTQAFLKNTDSTHLFFIDADIHFNPEDVLRLIAEDKEIICGIYPKKEINWVAIEEAVRNNVPTNELKHHTGSFVVNLVDYVGEVTVPIDQPVEIFNGGTGFMLIKREVFEKMQSTVPFYFNDVADLNGTVRPQEQISEYFATSIEPETGRLLSEDYHFCYNWRKMGGKVWAAPYCRLSHIGTYAFDGKLIPSE